MNFVPDINVFEEVNSATPPQPPPHVGPVFPNFPAQDVVESNAIDRSTRRTPIYVDTAAEIGRTEGPIFRDETEAGNDLGGHFEAATGGFEAGPEFEALKEGMADIGREDRGGHAVFGHTTPLYHPYAEPLSHYNPLG